MLVWLIESGDYEQRSVDGVADSLEAAVAFLKECYPPPYKVRWGELVKVADDEYEIIGHFAPVLHYSRLHNCRFTMTPVQLQTLTEEAGL